MTAFQGVTLQSVQAFRTVYALSDISKNNKRLKATHYAVCLSLGRAATWGVFSAQTGRLQYLCEGRTEVERLTPRKVWRIKQASVTLGKVGDVWDAEEKLKHLRRQIKGRR